MWRFVKREPEMNFARMGPAHLLQFLPQEDVFFGLRKRHNNGDQQTPESEDLRAGADLVGKYEGALGGVIWICHDPAY